jgi:exosortase
MGHASDIPVNLARRNLSFSLFWIASLVPFWAPLNTLISLAFQDDRYSHIVLIPFMSMSLAYLERKRIFQESEYCPRVGLPLALFGIILYCFAKQHAFPLGQDNNLALVVSAIILVWIAAFVLCYGTRPFVAARFSLFFLVLMIPIPTILVQKTSVALQNASAEIAYALFTLVGVPVFRQGVRFSLPGVDIEIAEQCSGIRSTLAFFIISLWAGHMFLHSRWRKVCFSLVTIPIIIFKNAVRIVTLSLLAIYVNRGFLNGRLHHYGGLAFGFLGLAILIPLLLGLQKSEAQPRRERVRPDSEEDGSARNGPTHLRPHSKTV